MSEIALIAAMANHRVIGMHNQMPWHLPADLKHFKAITLGKPIIMGRKTFESLGRALPGRDNLVVSRQTDYDAPGATVYANLENALSDVKHVPEIMVIGGAQLFEQALPLADRLYLTFIDLEVEGDTFFPEWDSAQWREVSREAHAADAHNPYAYTFITFKKH